MGAIKSLGAGLVIGLAGSAYLLSGDRLIGSILFTIGLITIIFYQMPLYTGRIAYLTKAKQVKEYLPMILLNLCGAFIMGLLVSPLLHEAAAAIIATRMAIPPLQLFIRSILCGAFVYLAVDLYKQKQDVLLIMLPVFAFVYCGCCHCIADTFYLAAAMTFAPTYLLICIAGNTVGALGLRLYTCNSLNNMVE